MTHTHFRHTPIQAAPTGVLLLPYTCFKVHISIVALKTKPLNRYRARALGNSQGVGPALLAVHSGPPPQEQVRKQQTQPAQVSPPVREVVRSITGCTLLSLSTARTPSRGREVLWLVTALTQHMSAYSAHARSILSREHSAATFSPAAVRGPVGVGGTARFHHNVSHAHCLSGEQSTA